MLINMKDFSCCLFSNSRKILVNKTETEQGVEKTKQIQNLH